MNENGPSINPEASPEIHRDNDPIAEQTRIRFALQRKLSQADEAQFLSDFKPRPLRRRWIGRILIMLIVLATIVSLGLWMVNSIALPRLMEALPSLIRSPYEALPGYKRIVKGFIDYYPPVSVSAKKISISEFDHGASFSFVSSADVVPHVGFEGVARIDFEKTASANATSDIDIGYRVLFPQKNENLGIYFFFNQWPSFLQQVGLTGESRGIWFGYDANDAALSQEGARELAGLMDPEQGHAANQKFIVALWRYAATKGSLRWKVERLYEKSAEGNRVAKIVVALDPATFDATLDSFMKDPIYTPDLQAIGEARIAGTTIIGLLHSVRSLEGRITIGVSDRVIHEAAWTFDINDPSAGMYRGSLTTTLSAVATKKTVTKPEKTQSAADIIMLFFSDGTTASTTSQLMGPAEERPPRG